MKSTKLKQVNCKKYSENPPPPEKIEKEPIFYSVAYVSEKKLFLIVRKKYFEELKNIYYNCNQITILFITELLFAALKLIICRTNRVIHNHTKIYN